MCQLVGPLPWRGSKEVRPLIDLKLGMPATGPRMSARGRGQSMAAVMIGVDPDKGSHTAVAIGAAEELLGQLRVRACAARAGQLLAWAAAWPQRTWAIEGAGGLGHLLARQLVAAGEMVLDVQPELAARVRLLAAGTVTKNDPDDARSVAVAALRPAACPLVRADDHAAVLKGMGQAAPGPEPVPQPGRVPAARGAVRAGSRRRQHADPRRRSGLHPRPDPARPAPSRRPAMSWPRSTWPTCAASTPSDVTPGRSWPRRCGPRVPP